MTSKLQCFPGIYILKLKAWFNSIDQSRRKLRLETFMTTRNQTNTTQKTLLEYYSKRVLSPEKRGKRVRLTVTWRECFSVTMSNTTNQTLTTVAIKSTASVDLCDAPIQRDFTLQTAFLILIMVVTFLGNFMVCLTVYLHRRLRTVTNYFIVSLAVSDLLISVLSLPFRINQTLNNGVWCLGYDACLTWIVVDLICSCASICNLAAISIDRYIAIVHPFRYQSVMTTKVGWLLIGIVWIYSGTWAALSSFNWTTYGEQHFFTLYRCRKKDKIFYTVVTACDFYLPLTIVLVMYGFVFRVAMNQARAVASLQLVASNNNGRNRRFSINIVKEVKAAKTLAIVIGAFTICWFPFFTLLLISLWNIKLLSPPQVSEQALKGLRGTFLYVLPAINSTLNPIIYALFNREFRTAFLRLLQRACPWLCTSSRRSANAQDSMQHSMNTTMTNGSPRSRKSPKAKRNEHAKKVAKFQEVYGERDSTEQTEEPKQV